MGVVPLATKKGPAAAKAEWERSSDEFLNDEANEE
jgi:hypothetical protein